MAEKSIGVGHGDFIAFPSDTIQADAEVTPGGAIVDVDNNTASAAKVMTWAWQLKAYPAGTVVDTFGEFLPLFNEGDYTAGQYTIALVAVNKHGRSSSFESDPFTIGVVAQVPILELSVLGPT